MKYTYFKKIIVFIVCIIICIPSLLINKNPDKISIIENRGLIKKPSFDKNLSVNSEYIRQLEAYIDDNIGLKQEAILLKNAALYFCFEKLNVPNYYMGKNQNLFYSYEMNQIDNYQGKVLLTKEEVDRLARDLQMWSELVKNNGGLFLCMFIPDKEAVYPEFYMESVLRINDKMRIDYLTDGMSQKEWFVNVQDALIANKDDKMLYYKNFDPTHWNMNGAWVAYKELMKSITFIYNDIKPLTEEDVSFTYEKGPGTLEHLSSIKLMRDIMRFDDEIVSCIPQNGFKAEKIDTPVIPLRENQIFYHYSNKMIDGKRLLIVGDSYIYSFLLPLLAESFSDVYFTNFIDAETIVELQKVTQPDIVVFENVDRAFYYYPLIENLEKMLVLY